MPTTHTVVLTEGCGELRLPSDVSQLDELLIVGAGGGGGSRQGAGGGAPGRVRYFSALAVESGGRLGWRVGAGGLGGTSSSASDGNTGQSSIFGLIEAEGGVGGASTSSDGLNGPLGSGAGRSTSIQTGGVGSLGFNGGGTDGSNTYGAGAAGNDEHGEDGLSANGGGGKGGDGLFFSQFTAYGESGWFGGGGGGSGGDNAGNGGQGGGGAGGHAGSGWDGLDGLPNTGGGGGGSGRIVGGSVNANAGNGGSGIIIVVFTTDEDFPVAPEPDQRLVNAGQLFFSGGDNNFLSDNSIGGAISRANPQSGVRGNIFRRATDAELTSGVTQYRCLFFLNRDPELKLENIVVWQNLLPLDSDTEFELGLDPEGVDQPAVSPADEFTAPSGVTFASHDEKGSALLIGDLEPGEYRAFWIKRTLAPSHAASKYDRLNLAFDFDEGTP